MRGGRLEVRGVAWQLASGAQAERVAPLLERALTALECGARDLKQGRRKQLYALALGGASGADHLLKVNLYASRRRLRSSKALRELRRAEAVEARGLPTVVPLAAGERRVGGRLEACYLLIPILPAVSDLRRFWLETSAAPAQRRAVARALGVLSRRVHEAGLHQDDFAPNNFLVRPGTEPALWVIDFERARLRRCLGMRRRRSMLAKLERHLSRASASDRMRFLLAYTQGDRGAARRWWRRVEAFTPRLAWRDHARMRRNAVRDGRRFARVEVGAWSGYRRHEVDEAPLLAAAEAQHAALGCGAQSAWLLRHAALSERSGRELWVLANSLWQRGGLVPRPLALLRRADLTLLWLAPPPGAQHAGAKAGRAQRAAVVRLLARLLALGEPSAPLRRSDVVFEPAGGTLRASLLAPERWRLRRRTPGGRLLRARGQAAALWARPD